jgi:hypothetical protein
VDLDDFLFAESPVRPVPGADSADCCEKCHCCYSDVYRLNLSPLDICLDNLVDITLVGITQAHNFQIVFRVEIAKLEIDHKDLGLAHHMVVQMKTDKGTETSQRIGDSYVRSTAL